jgi:ketosteroid isomerase-like protein
VSKENVEIVRRGYELLATARDESARRAIYAEFVHPDAEFVPPASYPDIEQSYRGVEEVLRFQQQIDEVWDDWRTDAERIFDAGDRVVVFVRVSGTAKQSGAPVAISTAHLLTVKDGRITRMEIFLDRREALKAVGLEE